MLSIFPISMKCCQFAVSLYPHVYQFWSIISIFNKMALIFLGVLIVFTVLSFEFYQVRLPWLHRYMMSGPNSPHLNQLHYWGKCYITSCNKSQKQFPGSKIHLSWFGLHHRRTHWQRCERPLQATAGMFICQRWRIWTFIVIIHLNNCYIWLNIIWCDLFSNEKFMSFSINWIE